MSRLFTFLLVMSLVTLYACNDDSSSHNHSHHDSNSSSANIPADQIAATVNGTVISKDDLKLYKELKGSPQIDDSQVLDELIVTQLLNEEANKLGITERESVRSQIRFQESELLARLVMREKFSTMNHTEEELKAAYDSKMSTGKKEGLKPEKI